jgi:hypothetical protein
MRILIAAAAVAACATVPPDEEKVPEHGAGVCDASRVQDLIGRQRSDALGAEALRRSGARALRWLAPDTAYTMDLRRDRLNIDVTKGGRVTGLRCF